MLASSLPRKTGWLVRREQQVSGFICNDWRAVYLMQSSIYVGGAQSLSQQYLPLRSSDLMVVAYRRWLDAVADA